jgi:hypothetical protein
MGKAFAKKLRGFDVEVLCYDILEMWVMQMQSRFHLMNSTKVRCEFAHSMDSTNE